MGWRECSKRGEAVGGGEEAVLRDEAGEGFESFLRPIAIELFAGERVEAIRTMAATELAPGVGES